MCILVWYHQKLSNHRQFTDRWFLWLAIIDEVKNVMSRSSLPKHSFASAGKTQSLILVLNLMRIVFISSWKLNTNSQIDIFIAIFALLCISLWMACAVKKTEQKTECLLNSTVDRCVLRIKLLLLLLLLLSAAVFSFSFAMFDAFLIWKKFVASIIKFITYDAWIRCVHEIRTLNARTTLLLWEHINYSQCFCFVGAVLFLCSLHVYLCFEHNSFFLAL